MLETLLQGVLLGGLYTLFALGQSLMFGVMRLTNTAQGDFIILGAFAVIAGVSMTGASVPWGWCSRCCRWPSVSATCCSATCSTARWARTRCLRWS
ncbi:ABC transporter permease subunit [Variovorax boronicumulans]|uniref:ABC transporter permease subunit n=1 Tax=Variovorax boronicumulans TaxID=436515 RepID=UPI0023E7FA16|nr:hypothetical protein [Variovorax boronicumulans]